MDKESIIFRNFLAAQKIFLERSKYYFGERTKQDPGDQYILQLIAKDGQKFREMWNLSICKECNKASCCGDNLKINCHNFDELK